MERLSTSALQPGMVIAEDVYNFNNTLILPKGLILTDKAITKLEFYSIISVRIEDAPVATSEKESATPSSVSTSYSSRLRSSAEFQQFKAEFEKQADVLSSELQGILDNTTKLDTKRLLDSVAALVPSEGNYVNVMDMLHNLRQYDDVTYIHSMNVALICNVFAHWLKMNDEEIKLSMLCGMLHDIGKMRIPNEVLKKESGLTEKEAALIKTHPSEGYQAVKNLNIDNRIKNAILTHHERLDGSGYPLGLSGNKLDLYSQIVAIADVYDAMTSPRIYRGPLCPFKVVALFEHEGYEKYNAKLIITFLENIVDTYLQYRVKLSNGLTGDVVYINKDRLSRPIVKVGGTYLDLSKDPSIQIEALL